MILGSQAARRRRQPAGRQGTVAAGAVEWGPKVHFLQETKGGTGFRVTPPVTPPRRLLPRTARPDQLEGIFGTAWPLLVLFDALFCVAILLGGKLAKRMAASAPPSQPGEVKTEARPGDGSNGAAAPAPAKEPDGEQLCYLCGKPLRGDELAARVCQACRA